MGKKIVVKARKKPKARASVEVMIKRYQNKLAKLKRLKVLRDIKEEVKIMRSGL